MSGAFRSVLLVTIYYKDVKKFELDAAIKFVE